MTMTSSLLAFYGTFFTVIVTFWSVAQIQSQQVLISIFSLAENLNSQNIPSILSFHCHVGRQVFAILSSQMTEDCIEPVFCGWVATVRVKYEK